MQTLPISLRSLNTLFTFYSSLLSQRFEIGNPPDNAPVPERSLDDVSLCKSGYGESKLASSIILEAASHRGGLETTIIRIGQVAGAITRGQAGAWPKHEWLPSIIASSARLRKLPESIGPEEAIDWVPVEYVAEVIYDLAAPGVPGPGIDRCDYRHIVAPHSTTWLELRPAVEEYFDNALQLVSLEHWVESLEQDSDRSAESSPGSRLIDFYKDLDKKAQAGRVSPRLDTVQTLKVCPPLRAVPKVGTGWMKLWLEQWAF